MGTTTIGRRAARVAGCATVAGLLVLQGGVALAAPTHTTGSAAVAKLPAPKFASALSSTLAGLFPGGLAGLPAHSSAEIRTVLNDYYDGGQNYQKARLCMYGTTARAAYTCAITFTSSAACQ